MSVVPFSFLAYASAPVQAASQETSGTRLSVSHLQGASKISAKLRPGPAYTQSEGGVPLPAMLPTNVYIRNFPRYYTESHLFAMFREFGRIRHVLVMRNIASGESMGFGFVRFVEHAAAQEAIEQRHGITLREGNDLFVAFAKRQIPDEREEKDGISGNVDEQLSHAYDICGPERLEESFEVPVTATDALSVLKIHGTAPSVSLADLTASLSYFGNVERVVRLPSESTQLPVASPATAAECDGAKVVGEARATLSKSVTVMVFFSNRYFYDCHVDARSSVLERYDQINRAAAAHPKRLVFRRHQLLTGEQSAARALSALGTTPSICNLQIRMLSVEPMAHAQGLLTTLALRPVSRRYPVFKTLCRTCSKAEWVSPSHPSSNVSNTSLRSEDNELRACTVSLSALESQNSADWSQASSQSLSSVSRSLGTTTPFTGSLSLRQCQVARPSIVVPAHPSGNFNPPVQVGYGLRSDFGFALPMAAEHRGTSSSLLVGAKLHYSHNPYDLVQSFTVVVK